MDLFILTKYALGVLKGDRWRKVIRIKCILKEGKRGLYTAMGQADSWSGGWR